MKNILVYIKNNYYSKRIIKKTLIILIWLLIWQMAALKINISFIFPGPVDVMRALCGLVKTSEYYKIIMASTIRISIGFILAFVTGVVTGIISGRYGIIREFLEPVMQVFKTVPVTAFIILVLIWFNSQNVAVIISFIITLPMIYSGILSGIADCDTHLIQMAQVFRISRLKKLRYIYIPQVYPYIKSSLKVAVGMCFKAGISAEVIGLTKNSIGNQMYYSKLYLMTADLFAWSITVVIVSFVAEKLFLLIIGAIKKLFIGEVYIRN